MKLEWKLVHCPRNEWTIERGGHSATQVGRKVYVFGGYSDEAGRQTPQPQHCWFDLNTYEWETCEPVADVEEGICYHTATLVDDRILVLGGFDEGRLTYFSDFHVRWFDPVMNTYTRVEGKGEVPTSRFRHVAGYFESKREVLIFGGKENITPLDGLFSMNVDTLKFVRRSWKGKAPPGQSSHFACMNKEQMFIFCNHGEDDEFELKVLDYSGRTPQWSSTARKGDIPRGVYGASMNYINGKLIVFAGVVQEEFVADLYVFDLKGQVWTKVTNETTATSEIVLKEGVYPEATARQVGILTQSKIMFIGGADGRLDEMWELHIS